MRVVVTGAAGFVGRSLLAALNNRGHTVTAIRRTREAGLPGADHVKGVKLRPDTNWSEIVNGIDAVIHLADGLRPFEKMRKSPGPDVESELVAATLNLARASIEFNVKNFVYLSSIKAGAGNSHDKVLTEADPPSATRPLYGRLKERIEAEILDLAAQSGLNVVCIRSPLVYGPGVSGNFLKLIELADSPWPLPFAGLDNRRSMVALPNLCSALCVAAENQTGISGMYYVHDGEALSVAHLFRRLRYVLDRPERLFTVPDWLFLTAESMHVGRSILSRLTKSLALCDERFRHDFSWQPVAQADTVLTETVDAYKNIMS